MLMVVEIMLTVSAWMKGWGWKALIPVAIAAGFAFFGGVAIATSGGTAVNKGAFIIIDILLVITQAVLASKAPAVKKETISESVEAEPTGEPVAERV